MRAVLSIAMILASVWVLEAARQDVRITSLNVGQTPVTHYAIPNSDGPIVVVAHGFAGSQQMMQGYALPLARAGYRVFAFEFLGHGRHPEPMSGDVTAANGTTQLLVSQTNDVIAAVADGVRPVALVGHSMATDILVRTAAAREDIGPMVLISAFSNQIDAAHPADLLLVTGAWEGGLRSFANEALAMVDPGADEGQTVHNGPVQRRAVAAPYSEHVSVLHSRVGRAEALDWLGRAYGRTSDVRILPTGLAILGLLFGLVLLFRRIAAFLPALHPRQDLISHRRLAIAVIVPAVVAPMIAVPLNPGFLPVLVADYLGLHLLIVGVIQLLLIRVWCLPIGRVSVVALCVLVLWCAVFGFALDRYAANFWPTGGRLWIIAVLMFGAVPYMLADAILGATTGFLGRLALRGGFLASLGLAVALDFEGLFFLIMIAPVLILFYLIFGTMGRQAAARAGPLSSGLALGAVLAWALGVSFPLFQS